MLALTTHLHGTSINSIKRLQKIIIVNGKGVKHKVHMGVLLHTYQMCEIGSSKLMAFLGLSFKLSSGVLELTNRLICESHKQNSSHHYDEQL